MAVVRELMPIPCPNGFKTSSVGRVSLYWSPRILSSSGFLNTLPDWSNWPAAVGSLTVEFHTNNGTVPPGNVVQKSTPSSTVWSALFDTAATVVPPFASTDRSNLPFRSFGERAVVADVMSLYRDVAINEPLTPPTVAELLPYTSGVLAGGGILADDLEDARAFQRRVGAVPATPGGEPGWDFYQALSLVGRHPHLMRLLGVVVDYEIQLGANPTNWIAATSDYETLFDPAGVNTVNEISPRVQVDSAIFRPAALRGELASGFLRLSDDDFFGLSELDVTAAITKLAALAREVESTSSTGALPALTDSGLSLLRTARPEATTQQFEDDAALEQFIQTHKNDVDANIPVYAEHIRVGYRVDVIRDDEDPLSLFQRKTRKDIELGDIGYHFPRDPDADTVPPADEGWVGTSLSVDRVQSGTPTNRLPESLARWRGWSLAVPPRGAVADGKTGETTRTANTARATDPVQLEVDYVVVPKTLPALRYGSTYQMRARVVDITGNSVPLDTPTPFDAPTAAKVYARLDPLPAPTVVRRENRSVPGVGDTTARVVIRSNYNTPYAGIATAQRLIFPPAASQLTCERHGIPNGGTSGSSTDYSLLAARDGLDVTAQCVADPVSGEPTAGGAATQTAGYLPDPAGPRVCLTGVPGTSGGAPVLADWAGPWPDWSTRRLIVQAAASGAPTVAGGGGPITVFLPKAAQHVIDLSVAPGNAFDEHFALWQEILAENPSNKETLRAIVREGRHWMISSRTRIKIVHAVRQPLSIPAFSALTATRPEVGSRSFTLTGTATLNRASTGRTILTGTWTDPVDDVTQPGPTQTSGQVVVGTQKVPLDGAAASAAVLIGHDFIDARRHQLFVKQEAFTRFARDFTEQKEVVLPGGGTALLDSHGVLAASVLVKSVDGLLTYNEGTDYLLDPAAGTLSHVAGGAIVAGSTVLARYVALPLSRMSDEAGAADFQVTIPNAKIPNALPVAAVVPSFIRKTTTKKKRISIDHNAHVVRCYLERPWFDTGVGEQLGVLLDPTSGALPAVPANTRFARDSLLRDGALPRPIAAHFPRGTHRAADGVHVMGHNVAYDSGRRQWYSDVQIAATLGYRAFIQLALARFQPAAVTGAHLSRVTVADAVLLGASRTTVVKRNRKKLTIVVAGAEHEGRVVAGGPRRYNQVTLSVQGADKKIADRELRWTKRPLGAAEIGLRRTKPAATTFWTKALKLRKIAKGKPIRLVIAESEPMAAAVGDGAGERLVYVPVYTEVIDLPKSWTKTKRKKRDRNDRLEF